MLANLLSRLTVAPTRALFHYTSLQALKGIMESRQFWVSELRHLNDTEELRHLGTLVAENVRKRAAIGAEAEVLKQFTAWLAQRLENGPLIFCGSFTESGNLLSQWRGYCSYGQGVSLGFSPQRLVQCANAQSFIVGRCVYQAEEKQAVACEIVDAVLATAREAPPSQAHPSQSYHPSFQQLESDIMRLGAFMKNAAFHEEQEWRVVSVPVSNYVDPPIKYRVGKTMLIPYLELDLPTDQMGKLEVPQVIIGPTPTMRESMRSLGQYLSKHVSAVFLANCVTPYRE